MNNVKKSVLACLALALCSFKPVEAKDKNKKDKDCCNLGTWIVKIVTAARTNPNVSSFTTHGVLTFLRDKEGCCSGTAILDTVPVVPAGTAVPAGFTTGQGTWTQCGPRTFSVALAGAVDQNGTGIFANANVLTRFTFTCPNTPNGVTPAISGGTFTFFGIDDLCLTQVTPPAPAISFTGTACHLASVCCPAPCDCK